MTITINGVPVDEKTATDNYNRLKASGLNIQEWRQKETLEYAVKEKLLTNEQALRFKVDTPQLEAFVAGIPVEDALRFEYWSQFAGYQAGLPLEKALEFIVDESSPLHIGVSAIELGANVEQAFKIMDNSDAYAALRLGAPIEEAVEFTDYIQIQALREGATPQEAKKFTLDSQLDAFRSGVTAEKSLEFIYDAQAGCLNTEKCPTIEDALRVGLEVGLRMQSLPPEPALDW